ncbi:gpi2 Phosphatidylinositol N-acetylglucosaminyltransferase GPI2 subunit [Candida maltosa Xu316]
MIVFLFEFFFLLSFCSLSLFTKIMNSHQPIPIRPQLIRSALSEKSERPIQPWKKLLYLQQPYPDNYTDKSFLSQLKHVQPPRKYSFWELAEDFSLIVFYLSCILIVNLMFIGMYVNNWDPIIPTLITTTISFFAFIFLENSTMNLKSLMVIIFILLIVSPILKSLTKSTSSDSIWAISFMLCLANALFHKYSVETSYRPILSTNISLSNAIVLASRLNNTLEVFAFVLFAVEINVLVPLYDAKIRQLQLNGLHWMLMTVMIIAVISTFYMLNLMVYTVYYLLIGNFIVFGLPLVYKIV